jgi:hypothetical protein
MGSVQIDLQQLGALEKRRLEFLGRRSTLTSYFRETSSEAQPKSSYSGNLTGCTQASELTPMLYISGSVF